MAKPAAKAPPEQVAQYEALIAGLSDVERKGAAFPYTAVNGNMFSMLTAEGMLALRLPPAEREALLEAPGARLQVSYGVVRPEYVEVPAGVFADTGRMARFVAASYAYAKSLKPKATTRPKKP
ncbi:TfoX/Sxy family protein [Phenylobacterium sp.]|uniref:TfoX/Sxy family protein n=1 Tax=Phenylobacterium sp. TaxID=1871053 RepID=UPI002DEC2F15|nr:TfoX/Sxy family protein [Phenylobacterium sp.]